MKSIKLIILGTLGGVILSIISMGIAYAGGLLLTGRLALPTVIVISTLVNGAVLGAVAVVLSYLTTGIERSGLITLVSLAVASLTVIMGEYSNGSLIPLGIYFLAISNSLLISRVTTSLSGRSGPTVSRFA